MTLIVLVVCAIIRASNPYESAASHWARIIQTICVVLIVADIIMAFTR